MGARAEARRRSVGPSPRHLEIDNLTGSGALTGVKAIAGEELRPDLHRVGRGGHVTYFTDSTVDDLIEDALIENRAAWPALERVISRRAMVGPSIVIDSWELMPAEVSTLQLPGVSAVWIDIDANALERRERNLMSFYGASHDPDRMLRNFVPRGAWWNDWIREEARTFGMRIFRQDGNRSVESLRDEVLETVS